MKAQTESGFLCNITAFWDVCTMVCLRDQGQWHTKHIHIIRSVKSTITISVQTSLATARYRRRRTPEFRHFHNLYGTIRRRFALDNYLITVYCSTSPIVIPKVKSWTSSVDPKKLKKFNVIIIRCFIFYLRNNPKLDPIPSTLIFSVRNSCKAQIGEIK